MGVGADVGMGVGTGVVTAGVVGLVVVAAGTGVVVGVASVKGQRREGLNMNEKNLGILPGVAPMSTLISGLSAYIKVTARLRSVSVNRLGSGRLPPSSPYFVAWNKRFPENLLTVWRTSVPM